VLLRDSVATLLLQCAAPSEAGRSLLTERLIQASRHAPDGDGREPSANEINSWNQSMPVLMGALHDVGLDRVEAMIEFRLPHVRSAIDVLLCGVHPQTGEPSYLAVELKNVRRASVNPECSVAVDLGMGGHQWHLHPVRQIQRYCEFLTRYLRPLKQHPERLAGAALLHNAQHADVAPLYELPQSDFGQLFTADDLEAFRRLLKSRFAPEPGGHAADDIRNARVDPLPSLTGGGTERPLDIAAGLVLLDEQECGFDRVLARVGRGLSNGGSGYQERQVFVFRGGPGSGKTAVARKLRQTLEDRGYRAAIASGSAAYTTTMRALDQAGAVRGERKRREQQAMDRFRFFNRAQLKMDQEAGSLDLLICDEAHRARNVSADQWTDAQTRRDSPPQVDELLQAARMSVFMLDDHQSIRPDEVGTLRYVRERAEALGYSVEAIDLVDTFRAGGSRRYPVWVKRLLGLDDVGPEPWTPDGRMHLMRAESPADLEQFIRDRDKEGGDNRVVAGYCWPWSAPSGGELVNDVVIGDWARPWNLRPNSNPAETPQGIPVAGRWATDPRGVGQIGCIYTAQNFDFNWVGVILGPDLVWRDGHFVMNREATADSAFRNRSVDDTEVHRCIKNVYYVLLTRGMFGAVVYSPDEETQDALRRLIPGAIQWQQVHGSKRSVLTADAPGLPSGFKKRTR
jgi:hypothetical protein